MSSVAAGTDVVWLMTEVSAAPVGPLDPTAAGPPEFCLTSTNVSTTAITTRMDPPAI